jgi:methanogenic corrinoid protein MtbC1
MAFGLALRRHGWRIVYLGGDTPLETVERAAEDLEPSLVVLSAPAPERVEAVGTKLRELARGHRLALGGQVA